MSRTIEHIREAAVDATLRMPLREWNWSEGVALYGLTTLWERTGSERIRTFLERWYGEHLGGGSIPETVNATAPWAGLMKLSGKLGLVDYADRLADRVDHLLHRSLRLANGAYEHTLTETKFEKQMWVDTLFMAGLFLTEAGLRLGNEDAVEEGLKQFHVHVAGLQQPNGLFYHGWDESKGSVIGCQWARGNAWAAVVAVELLRILPERYAEDRRIIRDVLHKQLKGLQAYQDLSGLWTTVVTEPGTYVESSAAAGIAYAVLRGIREGSVDPSFGNMARKAYRAVCALIDHDGVLRGVSSGTGVQSHPGEYHVIARDRLEGYGQGLLLMMLSEEL
ncbi:glycoside hydrolase family 105 protein [Paenibacillus sp. PAMC21692]|uniref:glycoside hydrolase family 88/105 protein n=1 Tax=Paenibacillus sp. PAMC21692 TaxID=2762320 RepID=UPI00164D9D0E|nr:glycoside hydrolase family 88 protein [Paenibacillus sp. PAMC21692]QNK59637.1 glycoside hydrolase family 88 protein [Paenibacillus sp. PAMC21692]